MFSLKESFSDHPIELDTPVTLSPPPFLQSPDTICFYFCFCFNILLKYSSIYIEKCKCRSIHLNDFHKRSSNQHIDEKIDHTGIPTWCYPCPWRNFKEAATKGLVAFISNLMFLKRKPESRQNLLLLSANQWSCICLYVLSVHKNMILCYK